MKVNLVPMAGEGKRFLDAGFKVPKPLIEIGGVPMIIRAAQSMPTADRYVFVCRSSVEHQIAPLLRRAFDDVRIVTVDRLTEGQAATCLLAEAHVEKDALLTIAASDNSMLYNHDRLRALESDPEVDGWVWTMRRDPSVLPKPESYGWVEVDRNGMAIRVSCKKPISSRPIDDHAVVGAFTYKRARDFFDATRTMIAQNARVNNEFYADVAADFAMRAGKRLATFEIDLYIGWGTPEDYRRFGLWEQYFAQS